MAATLLKSLAFGTSLPVDSTSGTVVETGSSIKITGVCTVGSGNMDVYEWVPELGTWELLADTQIAVNSGLKGGNFCGRFAMDRDSTRTLFLLVPGGITLTYAHVRGVYLG
jgi:hypothetical protein